MKQSWTGLSRFLLIAVAALLGWSTPSWAQTFPITIDPQAFLGSYNPYVSNPPGHVSGIQVYNLAPGTYNVEISFGSCSSKAFTVNGDGTVSNPITNDSSGAFDFIGSTVRFKNSTVNFDGGAYLGQISVHLSGLTNTGFVFVPPGNLVVVPDTVYRIRLTGAASHTYFRINASGQAEAALLPAGCNNPSFTVPSDTALTFNGNTVTFRNTTVRFDPIGYTGLYAFSAAFLNSLTGPQNLITVPGFDYQVNISSADVFWIKVNGDGTLGYFPAVKDSTNQIQFDNAASPPTVKFKNVAVNFNPDQYLGIYTLSGQYLGNTGTVPHSPVTGPFSLILVPDTSYEMNISASRILYSVDPVGNFRSVPPGNLGGFTEGANVFVYSGNTATFRNTKIFVAPNDGSTWAIVHVKHNGVTGSLQLTVVPGGKYRLQDFDETPNNLLFDVLSPCSISPAGGVTFPNTFFHIVCVPMAHAGADQTVNEEITVSLNGTGSSFPSNGQPGYQWTQVAGPTVTLDDPTSATPSFTSPAVSTAVGSQILTFQLVVNDGGAFSDADTVDITVVHVNKKPVADAGDNFNLREGAVGHLDSSHSYDPDGDPLSGHTWTQTNGPAVNLQPSGNVASPTFTTPLGNQTLLFQLQVSDGQLLSDLSSGTSAAAGDTVQVTVGSNTAPIANAGADQTINEGTQVQLDGTQSSDSDGDGLTYAWIQTGGSPIVTLNNPASATPSFSAPFVGGIGATLTFSLFVTDTYAANPKSSVADTVDVHVLNLNDPPRCDLAVPSLTALWPPNHKMVEVTIGGVTDPNTDPVTITVTSVTQDEPVNGLGDGDTSPDAVVQTGSLLLRAERSGTGNGRVYVVHFTANDGEGACNGTVTVGVPHDRKDNAINDGQAYASTTP